MVAYIALFAYRIGQNARITYDRKILLLSEIATGFQKFLSILKKLGPITISIKNVEIVERPASLITTNSREIGVLSGTKKAADFTEIFGF